MKQIKFLPMTSVIMTQISVFPTTVCVTFQINSAIKGMTEDLTHYQKTKS